MLDLSFATEFIDMYCEREHRGLFGEPLNLFSNLAFIFSFFASRRILRRGAYFSALLWATFCVGIGSGLFHALATKGGMILDVVPIGVYILLAHVGINRYVFGGRCFFTANTLYLAGFLGVCLVVPKPLFLEDSAVYLGVLCYLCRLSFLEKTFRTMFFVFLVALSFRILDRPLCELNPYGTHFLWHITNSLLLYLMNLRLGKAR